MEGYPPSSFFQEPSYARVQVFEPLMVITRKGPTMKRPIMNRVKLHSGHAPIVIVKTGGLSAAVTAAATVGIFAVTTITAVAIAETLVEVRTKVDKFIGDETSTKGTSSKGTSKEIVKDTFRTKTKRVVAKSFLKNLFK